MKNIDPLRISLHYLRIAFVVETICVLAVEKRMSSWQFYANGIEEKKSRSMICLKNAIEY
jgi:hypothetical protein